MGVNPRSGMQIGSNETIKQAVMAGLGIALLSAHTVIPEISDGRLRIIPVYGFPVMRSWYVVRRQERRFLPAAEALWNSFASSGDRFLPDITDMIRAANRQAPRSRRGRAKG
jgi:LysR family transcriptional regulator for metE and metH